MQTLLICLIVTFGLLSAFWWLAGSRDRQRRRADQVLLARIGLEPIRSFDELVAYLKVLAGEDRESESDDPKPTPPRRQEVQVRDPDLE
jgi:hypothetical protein